MAGRIEGYGLIGDLQTVALVSRYGCIDWMCVPRFDSGAIFASLLGVEENGHWTMQPQGEFDSPGRRYRGETLVLETDFETPSGAARLIDFMPPRGEAPDIVRIVEGVRGTVDMRMELALRFDYGSIVPWVRNIEGTLVGIAGPDAVAVRTPVELEGRNLRTYAEFTVRQREPVMRSLLTLKALTFAPTGGIVAAATTSLPEELGGVRNWDYRYCWLRDATLTLSALLACGYQEEAEAWRNWLLRAVAGDPADLQIMYGLAGERRLPEFELPWLSGFAGSRPVRIG